MAPSRLLALRSTAMDPREPRQTGRPRPSGSLLFVLVISGVVMAIAVLVAVWMYWLGGALPG